jgi:hypothetical protein
MSLQMTPALYLEVNILKTNIIKQKCISFNFNKIDVDKERTKPLNIKSM